MIAELQFPSLIDPQMGTVLPNALAFVLSIEEFDVDGEGFEVSYFKIGRKDPRILIMTDFSNKKDHFNRRIRPTMQISGPGIPEPRRVSVPDEIIRQTLNCKPKPHGWVRNRNAPPVSGREIVGTFDHGRVFVFTEKHMGVIFNRKLFSAWRGQMELFIQR